MTFDGSENKYRHGLSGLFGGMLIVVILSAVVSASATASAAAVATSNVINDMNNMLRDASATASITSTTTKKAAAIPIASKHEDNFDWSNDYGDDGGERMQRVSDGDGMTKDDVVNRNYRDEDISGSISNSNEMDDSANVELLRFIDEEGNSKSDDDNDVNDINDAPTNTKTTTATTSTKLGLSGKSSISSGDDSTSSSSPSSFSLSLEDQVRLLTKQLNALMTRRREDYELLEHNLRKSLKSSLAAGAAEVATAATTTITTTTAAAAETASTNVRSELEQLRSELKSLRDSAHLGGGNKERLTVEWLQQSVSELRKQIVELQQLASKAVKDVNRRGQAYEDMATMRNDFQQLKLEVTALKERQQKTEVYVHELREEVLQQEEDFRRAMMRRAHHQEGNDKRSSEETGDSVNDHPQEQQSEETSLSTSLLADHRRRHCRFQRQQIHELQLAQRQMKQQINELKYHRIDDRVRNIEIEQHRIAEANFNLSRQIASLDKLRTSMLELLEDVEGLQNKMDKSIPELRHEISKLEFTNAQLLSEQNLVREEGKNVARSVQAMAVSVSSLQEERDGVRQTRSDVTQLQTRVDRMQSMLDDVQRALMHHRSRGALKQPHSSGKTMHASPQQQQQQQQSKHQQYHQSPTHYHNNDSPAENASIYEAHPASPSQNAVSLVAKLENVEQQYESIIDKLPQDCSEASTSASASSPAAASADGLYLIAPAGQHHPLMAHCSADGWTTVQRRYDGSADFNRSWADYADGFGAPAGEFWIGNEQLHHLTLNNCTALRVLMQDIYDNVWLAEYDNFYISSRSDGYRLHISGYHGNASDALDYQQGMQFSAIDVDRDISQTHCAANYEGGWWFSHCQHANLNGRYNLGLTWFDAARNEWIAVKSSQMLIRRHSATVCNAASSSLPSSTYDGVPATANDDDSVTVATMSSSKLTVSNDGTPSSATFSV